MKERKIIEDLLSKVIEVLEEQNYVTRNEVSSIDMRNLCRKLMLELEHLGYKNLDLREIALPGYLDYSNIIFNKDIFTLDDVREIMYKEVLGE